MQKRYNNLAAVMVLGLVVMMALTAVSCRRTASNDDTNNANVDANNVTNDIANNTIDNSLTNSIANSIIDTSNGLPDANLAQTVLKSELAKATEGIKKLKSDVVLQLVSMKFSNSLSDNGGLVTNYYIFVSPSDPKYYYMVNVPHNGESIKRFLMPIEDMELPFSLIPVNFQFWKLSYVDALKLAEENGGSTFRTQHPKYEVSVILGKPVGQYLNWFVTYRAMDISAALLQLSIDAYDGKVQTPAR